LLLLVSLARPALAHVQLLKSDPADGARLDAVPTEVHLTFSNRIEADKATVSLTIGTGAATKMDVAADGKVLTAEVPAEAASTDPSDPWKVEYRIVSADGHPIKGSITFTVATVASAEPTPEPTPTSATTSPSPSASPVADQDTGGSSKGGSGGRLALIGVVVVALVGAGAFVLRRRGAGS
jgi:methionine-rich copper-binding protein CopC